MGELNLLALYTIYGDPADFPGKFVLRRSTIRGSVQGGAVADPEPMIVADSLAAVRRHLEDTIPGLYCLGRQDDDDPVIVETWI